MNRWIFDLHQGKMNKIITQRANCIYVVKSFFANDVFAVCFLFVIFNCFSLWKRWFFLFWIFGISCLNWIFLEWFSVFCIFFRKCVSCTIYAFTMLYLRSIPLLAISENFSVWVLSKCFIIDLFFSSIFTQNPDVEYSSFTPRLYFTAWKSWIFDFRWKEAKIFSFLYDLLSILHFEIMNLRFLAISLKRSTTFCKLNHKNVFILFYFIVMYSWTFGFALLPYDFALTSTCQRSFLRLKNILRFGSRELSFLIMALWSS